LDWMRLRPCLAPLAQSVRADAHHLREFARAAVRTAVGRRSPGLGQDTGFECGRRSVGGCPQYFARKPASPFALESLFPSIDVMRETPTAALMAANDGHPPLLRAE